MTPHSDPSGHSLVSASEDGTIKVWDATKFSNYKDLLSEGNLPNYEPYVNLRGHSTPIFALSGREDGGLVISGGKNGKIKAWMIPPASQFVDPYGTNKDQSFCIASWDSAHSNQPVWDLKIHPYENIFLSVGADNSIGLWQIPNSASDYSYQHLSEK